MEAGLNLFSIRGLIGSEKGFLDTCEKLREMGYSFLQYSGAEFIPERIAKEQRDVGLPVVLTHVPMDRILNDTHRLMEEHALVGCRNIGLGMMPLYIIRDEKKCLETITRLDRAGRTMAENGFRFFYHFHHFEFAKLSDGQRIIDFMIDCCPYINFTADTYWIQYGGGNIEQYLDKMSGRIECIHLKDYAVRINEKGEFVPVFAPVGSGNLNFAPIIAQAKASGVKYFLVEQDNANAFANPLGQVRMSIETIRSW